MEGHVATAEVEIAAPAEKVWAALTEPTFVARWMHGSVLETDWQVGSPITWSGEHDGKAYQDKGEVLVFEPDQRLSVTHYSPMMGRPDEPESYHTLDYRLAETPEGTRLSLEQDGNESAEQAVAFSGNWQQMLEGLRDVVGS